MSLLTFNFNKNLIYALIYWLLEISFRIATNYLPQYFEVSKDLKENEYMFIVLPVIAKLLSGFLALYIYCVSHRKGKNETDNKYKLIYKNPKDNKNKFYYLKLLFIAFLELLARACFFIYFIAFGSKKEEIDIKNTKDGLTLMDILSRYILSIVILKIKTFKHHIWAIYVMIFGFFLIIPFDLLDLFKGEDVNKTHTAIYFIVLSCQSIIYPLEDTFIKKFFNTYFILPEKMLFSISICEAIIVSIISIILYFLNVIKFDLMYNTGIIIGISIFILETAVREYIIIKFIYLYSSQSVAFLIISQSIAVSLLDIINFIKEKDKGDIGFQVYLSFPFEIIALILIIFSTSVYDEIIIINKCGLNSNVKRGIFERAQIDIEFATIEHLETLDDLSEDKSIIN